MKTKIKTMSWIASASLLALIACNKTKQLEPTSTPVESETPSNAQAKSSAGYNVVALQRNSTGACNLNTSYSIISGGGSFVGITYLGAKLTHLNGVSSVKNIPDYLFGTTTKASNFPGKLFRINSSTKVASLVGDTRIGSSTGPIVYLQDIERTVAGDVYFAIEVGSKNIYVSVPGAPGNPPLIWNLAASLPNALGVSTELVGLDIYTGNLVVFGQGQIPGSPFPNVAGKSGYYVKYTISGASLSFVGGAGTNLTYTPAAGEDAALLISDDTSINGTFATIPTPYNGVSHYFNSNTNLPYWLVNATTNFSGTLPSAKQLVDFTYFN